MAYHLAQGLWLRSICEDQDRFSNLLFPIAAYPYSVYISIGLGLEKDTKRSIDVLREAFDIKSYPQLANALGDAFESGIGTDINYTEAIRHFKLAAANNFSVAICNVGLAYINGHGVHKDLRLAFDHFQRAYNNGHMPAVVLICDCYVKGLAIIEGNADAMLWYQKAADAGYVGGDVMLARGYYDTHENELCAKWSKSTMEKANHIASAYTYALLLVQGKGLPCDNVRACEIFKFVAAQGPDSQFHGQACMMVFFTYLDMINITTTKKDEIYEKALIWLHQAFTSRNKGPTYATILTNQRLKMMMFSLACKYRRTFIIRHLIEACGVQTDDVGSKSLQSNLDFGFPIMAELGLPLMYANGYPIEVAVDYDLDYPCIKRLAWKRFTDEQFQLVLRMGLPVSRCIIYTNIDNDDSGWSDRFALMFN